MGWFEEPAEYVSEYDIIEDYELQSPSSRYSIEEPSESMTDEERNEEIRISIKKLQKELHELNSESPGYYSVLQIPPENCIFKVHRQLLEVNPEAYKPQTISIGPYHHGEKHLKAMEVRKKYCLNTILRRSNVSLETYVEAMIEKEEKARRYYADPVNMSLTKFAEMMLLDGCFIVELIRLVRKQNNPDQGGGHLLNVKLDLPELAYDLLLLENQLPLFVVQDLLDMSRMPDEEETFIDKALSFFCEAPNYKKGDSNGVKHLLELVYQQCIPNSQGITTGEGDKNNMFQPKLRTMRHAIALEEAGVKFIPKNVEQKISLFDITFENGTMEIPSLRVDNHTQRILRNLMAYEQFIRGRNFVCDYAMFMDCLINSDKDVELLHRHGVIDNWLGDHEAVAKMFNRLCQHVKISSDSYYLKTYVVVDKYCQEPWNEWMATLRHDYFNSPWALISYLAALLLLLVTVAQLIVSLF